MANWIERFLAAIAFHKANASAHHVKTALYTEGARVYHSASQTIPDAVGTYLAFDSERYDTDNIHDPTTDNGRLTCKTAGKYAIMTCIAFSGNSTGYRYIIIRLNRSTSIVETEYGVVGNVTASLVAATIYDLIVGDYVEVQVYQNSGAPLDVRKLSQISTEFMMQRIG